jgi:hypothetical protein
MNNHEAIIRQGPRNRLGPCLQDLKKVMPNSTGIQRLVVASWWTGKQPRALQPILRIYTVNILERDNG